MAESMVEMKAEVKVQMMDLMYLITNTKLSKSQGFYHRLAKMIYQTNH